MTSDLDRSGQSRGELQTQVTGWIVFGAGMFGWGITAIVVGRR